MTEYLLETRALSKSFKKTEAVKKLNLRVRKNTIYSLLGPNGAGKSTPQNDDRHAAAHRRRDYF